MTTPPTRRDQLVVALDVETGDKALHLVESLKGQVGMFKIGKQLFTAEGPDLVRRVVDLGERVFLDLKYHDIPATVAKASVEATKLGVSMFNVHASGGREMLAETVDAVNHYCEMSRTRRPAILAVTVLTSLDDAGLEEAGVPGGAVAQVVRLARLAREAGIDGVVASAQEIRVIHSEVVRDGFLILTPGIRPAGADPGDQKRVMTPARAIAAGADYIVVGRPITAAADPAAAARAIVAEMESTAAAG
ncbi:MAG TPA: orotidine-5'-phosphate decarboxylase [Blastocatellia bacterium]|nr:orotidine-5'-phosphate decarboxylase [Blastocatellia bacterium]